jgi:hypothetical protein
MNKGIQDYDLLSCIPIKKGVSFGQFQPLRESFGPPSFQVTRGERVGGKNALSKKGPFLMKNHLVLCAFEHSIKDA